MEIQSLSFIMKFFKFEDITNEHNFIGGKAHALGLMSNSKFPVPPGAVLSEIPANEEDWSKIYAWWKSIGKPKLAIRSSALGEDSGMQSFAGQNSTFLNIDDESNLKKSIINCFDSINKKSSTLYRDHFLKKNIESVKMNVILQQMVDPLYSGVFFSIDPRSKEKNWILEAIEGYGEALVSGHQTPYHFEENNTSSTNLFNIEEIISTGKKVRDFFNHEIDMEWAIDKNHNLFVLQARPITGLDCQNSKNLLIEKELERLISTHVSETIWDGQTFSEWSGPPSLLTFSIWREAFSANRALSKALKRLGYEGINEECNPEEHSLVEKIFGRAYVNVSQLAPHYFGSIPFKMKKTPSPHLVFDYQKMTLSNFMHTPITFWKMLKVGWILSTQRKHFLNECTKDLSVFNFESFEENFEKCEQKELIELFSIKSEKFYTDILISPLVLIVLIESTIQNLKILLGGFLTKESVEQKLNLWMSYGIHSVTMNMNKDYQNACLHFENRHSFLKKYGHRGPGELDLAHPRWNELGDKIFYNISEENKVHHVNLNIIEDIRNLKTYKKQAIENEWLLLKEMLELREAWKMALLRPYAELRYLAKEIAKKENIEDCIFWHDCKEISNNNFNIQRADIRKEESNILKSISLPTILSLNDLKHINGKNSSTHNNYESKEFNGTPLSPGVAYGQVRVVLEPETIDTDTWPSDVILVAQSTDPGWTGLFLKSKAVIAEKGGVLSHCAILAREMNLPAISDIKQCHLKFKDGDKIWVDGSNGHITYI
jgi:phosphohistidine swiveling domain-containing protein